MKTGCRPYEHGRRDSHALQMPLSRIHEDETRSPSANPLYQLDLVFSIGGLGDDVLPYLPLFLLGHLHGNVLRRPSIMTSCPLRSNLTGSPMPRRFPSAVALSTPSRGLLTLAGNQASEPHPRSSLEHRLAGLAAVVVGDHVAAGVAEELLDEVRLAIGEACTRAVAC